ncbi:MAG: hypothetical protein ACFB00_03040 [Parvularculaceae bacterium]
MTYFDRVIPIVDDTIEKLARKEFVEDPIAGPLLSAQTSIISSAYKRHGKIIEAAMIEGLRDSNRFEVWSEAAFKVSKAADTLIGLMEDSDFPEATLPYGYTCRTVQIDLIAYDHTDQVLGAYEIKRGNGHHDSGKQRSMKRDLQAIQILLKNYGATFNKPAETAHSRIIFYYGMRSIPRPFSLVGEELDDHFGYPIQEKIEKVNEYFRTRLFEILSRLESESKARM